MKHLYKISVGLVMGWGLTLHARTNDAMETNNPYDVIAARNIFGLVAPVPETPTVTEAAVPKITINGMMSIFGRYQVLFKASPVQPSAKDKDAFYVLSEQQKQDGFAVLHINDQTGVVTFDNHGTVQDITLAGWVSTNSLLKTVSAPGEAPPVEANVPKSYPASFIRAHTPDYLGGGSDSGLTGEQVPPASTPEERMILIEAQRAYLKSHNDPAADLLPPTALTPP